MADLEAVLADVSYLMAMEKSKATPAARASKKIVLPEPRYRLPGPAPPPAPPPPVAASDTLRPGGSGAQPPLPPRPATSGSGRCRAALAVPVSEMGHRRAVGGTPGESAPKCQARRVARSERPSEVW